MNAEGPRVREDLPHDIREIENVFIPMRDGCRISARLWLPADANERPVPVILEYIPYRKRDFMRTRDEPIHRYFAGHGYAAARVDVRGTGDSEGILGDEYTAQEHVDALDIIEWLAAQAWCDGNVGMMGISWGGFNSLQVAALAPPALKAVISLCSTDDRYADDAHYMGGCLLNENFQWGSILTTYASLPPDPHIVGERWREEWQRRLQALRPFAAVWMEHPWRDDYWRHGSVCEDYRAIRCAVYAIGGWADGYSNAVPRLLEGLQCPRKGLVGPWAHVFPHDGVPGPAIGFLQEALRWWDQWLRQRDTGIMDEPMYRVWLQESVAPRPQYHARPGRWIAESQWPSDRIEAHALYLSAQGLQHAPAEDTPLSVCSPQTTGAAAGEWCAFGADGEMPTDQRIDDGRSLPFDSATLDEPMEILGAPVVELEMESTEPVALLCARLNEVAPDGTSTRVSYGLLNLTHRDGHAHPQPVTPGERMRVRLQLNDIAHRFPAGHAIRLAFSSSYWPVAWPAPRLATLTVHTANCRLWLPVRSPREEDAELKRFPPPEVAPGADYRPLKPLAFKRSVELDLANHESIYTLRSDGGEFGGHEAAVLEPIDMELGYRYCKQHRISDVDPARAHSRIEQSVRLKRSNWSIEILHTTELSCDTQAMYYDATLEARENGAIAATRKWNLRIPRALY